SADMPCKYLVIPTPHRLAPGRIDRTPYLLCEAASVAAWQGRRHIAVDQSLHARISRCPPQLSPVVLEPLGSLLFLDAQGNPAAQRFKFSECLQRSRRAFSVDFQARTKA